MRSMLPMNPRDVHEKNTSRSHVLGLLSPSGSLKHLLWCLLHGFFSNTLNQVWELPPGLSFSNNYILFFLGLSSLSSFSISMYNLPLPDIWSSLLLPSASFSICQAPALTKELKWSATLQTRPCEQASLGSGTVEGENLITKSDWWPIYPRESCLRGRNCVEIWFPFCTETSLNWQSVEGSQMEESSIRLAVLFCF